MRLLVIGGSGLVGSHILTAAQAAGHSAFGTFHTHPQSGLEPFDATDRDRFRALLDAHQPEAVVHAAGWTWVDGCEDDPDRARRENATQPAGLAALCTRQGIRFSYVSTSYVFDGQHGPYAEDDTPRPINAYARSKLEGERAVLEATNGTALIPRIICVYGAETQRKNFAWQVLRAMQEGRTLTLPSDQRGNPSYAGDLSRWMIDLLARGASGIWHLAGPNPNCTRPEWAERLVKAFRTCGIEARPGFGLRCLTTAELKQNAPRPLHAGMWTRKLGSEAQPTDFLQSIRDLLHAEGTEALRIPPV